MVLLGEKPWVKSSVETDAYGKFTVEPLERGFGATIGNTLRRVLLSSLPGAAITAIKIEGVPHEFSTIPGVVEDVLELILNVKGIVLRCYSDAPKTVTLEAKGAGDVLAGSIEHDAEVEVVNPNHKIATLESGAKLSLQLMVERGKGFVDAEKNKKPNQPVGTIPVDSIFTPMRKVNVTTEEIRVGQEIRYDRLLLEVWTNGGIRPDEAVKEAAKILSDHIDMFIHLDERKEVPVAPVIAPGVEPEVLEMGIEDLELSARSENCLKKANILKVADVLAIEKAALLKIKNLGERSIKEIQEKLAEYGLRLKGDEASEGT